VLFRRGTMCLVACLKVFGLLLCLCASLLPCLPACVVATVAGELRGMSTIAAARVDSQTLTWVVDPATPPKVRALVCPVSALRSSHVCMRSSVSLVAAVTGRWWRASSV
jgi:hypothetical protein